MDPKHENMLDRYDEMELMELGQEDVYGGTAWACATVTAAISVVTGASVATATMASAAACPTTKCSSKC